MRSAAAENKA
jgi:hypothetical protein